MGRLMAHTPAAVSGDGVEPDGQLLRIFDLGQVFKRTKEHLLHSVFRIFRMPTDFHAEGIDSTLKQPDRLFNGFRGLEAKQICGLYQFGSHRMRLIPLYLPCRVRLPIIPTVHSLARKAFLDKLTAHKEAKCCSLAALPQSFPGKSVILSSANLFLRRLLVSSQRPTMRAAAPRRALSLRQNGVLRDGTFAGIPHP